LDSVTEISEVRKLQEFDRNEEIDQCRAEVGAMGAGEEVHGNGIVHAGKLGSRRVHIRRDIAFN